MADIKDTKAHAVPGNATDTDDNTLAEVERPTAAAVQSSSQEAIAESNGTGIIRNKETDPEKGSIPPASSGDDDDDDDDNDAVAFPGVIAPSASAAAAGGDNNLAQVTSYNFAEVPDGGWQAWLVVFGAWCTSFCSFGWINSVGIFQEYYETGPLSSLSSSTISWIPSLQIFFIMAMGPIVGRLFDAYGPRHVILGGSLLHVFGLMMASISTQYYQLLLSQGVCSAIGVSAIFQPALSCIPGWFSKRRGAAYGIVSTGSSLGGVIFPIMVSRLIDSVGYGWAMRASAFLILGLLFIANLTVRSRFHAHPNFKPGKGLTRAQMIAPFREPAFAVLLTGMFFLTFGIFAPITYIPVAALGTGNVTPSLAQYLVSILNAASLFGRLLSGWASDRIGKYNAFIASCYVAGITVLALWIPGTSQSATIAFAALFGFFSGAYISLIASLVAQVSPQKEIGYRTGLVFLTGSIPGLVTSPIAGAILSNGNNWVAVKVFAGVFLLVGSTVTLISRIMYAGYNLLTVF